MCSSAIAKLNRAISCNLHSWQTHEHHKYTHKICSNECCFCGTANRLVASIWWVADYVIHFSLQNCIIKTVKREKINNRKKTEHTFELVFHVFTAQFFLLLVCCIKIVVTYFIVVIFFSTSFLNINKKNKTLIWLLTLTNQKKTNLIFHHENWCDKCSCVCFFSKYFGEDKTTIPIYSDSHGLFLDFVGYLYWYINTSS